MSPSSEPDELPPLKLRRQRRRAHRRDRLMNEPVVLLASPTAETKTPRPAWPEHEIPPFEPPVHDVPPVEPPRDAVEEPVDTADAAAMVETADSELERKPPLYWRLLRLRHVQPNGWQRAMLAEGVLAIALILVLAGKASVWTLLVLPVIVAVLVKAHDLLAGAMRLKPQRQHQHQHRM